MLEKKLRKIVTFFLFLLFPVKLIYRLLNLLGHEVDKTAKVGFVFVWVDEKIVLGKKIKIGNFNFLKLRRLYMYDSAYLDSFNKINAKPLHLILQTNAALGNNISIYSPSEPVSYGNVTMKLGIFSKLTSNHKIDLMRSVYIGDFSTIAGSDTQMWTHGYYHSSVGIERIRIDGEIHIGNNVYVGSRCTFMPGVRVADGIHIGANCCISKSLEKSGMYVSQSLRYIENDIEKIRKKLDKVEGYELCEEVYEKKT